MENEKGILMVVSGPSGSGKGTVLSELMAQHKDIFYSVSATTRAPRPGEKHGEQYFFISKEEFEQEIAAGGMLEYASYCDNYYGTPKKPVFDQCNSGHDVILEIEVQGALQVMESCREAVTVFIMPPSLKELENRLTGRQTESEEIVRKRMQTAVDEMKEAGRYDYIVFNHTVEEAVQELASILRAEKCRRERMRSKLEQFQ